jgi:hypothetical protein
LQEVNRSLPNAFRPGTPEPNYGLAFGYLSAEEIMKKKVTLFIGAHLAVFASVAALAGYGGGR